MIKVQFGPVLNDVVREFDAYAVIPRDDGGLELLNEEDDLVVIIAPGHWVYAQDMDPIEEGQ